MERMKVEIRKDVYNKVNALAKANSIPLEVLTNILLTKMMNDNHMEIPEIIKKVKTKNAR
jgi:hypothetical protein